MLKESQPPFVNELSQRLQAAIKERGMVRRLMLANIKEWLEKVDFKMACKMVLELPTLREVEMFLGTGSGGRLFELGIVRKVQLESPS